MIKLLWPVGWKLDCLVQPPSLHLRHTSSHCHPTACASHLPYLASILTQILLNTHLIPSAQVCKSLTLCLSQCWSHGRNSMEPVMFHQENTNSYVRYLCARHNWCKKYILGVSSKHIREQNVLTLHYKLWLITGLVPVPISLELKTQENSSLKMAYIYSWCPQSQRFPDFLSIPLMCWTYSPFSYPEFAGRLSSSLVVHLLGSRQPMNLCKGLDSGM